MPGAMYVRRAMTEGMKGSDFLPSREPGRLPGTGVPAFHPEDEFGGGRGFEKTFEASSRPFGLLSPEGGSALLSSLPGYAALGNAALAVALVLLALSSLYGAGMHAALLLAVLCAGAAVTGGASAVLRRPNTKLRLATLVLIGLACVAAFNFKTVVVDDRNTACAFSEAFLRLGNVEQVVWDDHNSELIHTLFNRLSEVDSMLNSAHNVATMHIFSDEQEGVRKMKSVDASYLKSRLDAVREHAHQTLTYLENLHRNHTAAMDAGVASKDIRRNERVVQAIASRMDNLREVIDWMNNPETNVTPEDYEHVLEVLVDLSGFHPDHLLEDNTVLRLADTDLMRKLEPELHEVPHVKVTLGRFSKDDYKWEHAFDRQREAAEKLNRHQVARLHKANFEFQKTMEKKMEKLHESFKIDNLISQMPSHCVNENKTMWLSQLLGWAAILLQGGAAWAMGSAVVDDVKSA